MTGAPGLQGELRHQSIRLAILATHPIQHFVPQYASVAQIEELSIRVFFASDRGLSPQYDKGFGREVAWEGLALDRFAHDFLWRGRTSGRLDDALDRGLTDFDPDAILVYGYVSPVARLGARWARAHRRKIVYCSDSELRHGRSRLREYALHLEKRRRLSRPDLFMTVGDANEEFYAKHGVARSRYIRTGFPIDVDRYSKARANRTGLRLEQRKALDLEDGEVALLTVGKLVSHKRQADLLEVTSMLNRAGDTRYVALLAGSGPDELEIAKRVADMPPWSVRLLGFVPHTQLPALYASADVYVHPAEVEPHSLAISEATYLGLPAVISDRCGSWGPSDDVRIGVNGVAYPCGDITSMRDAIHAIGSDPLKRQALGDASSCIAAETQLRAHRDAWRELARLLAT